MKLIAEYNDSDITTYITEDKKGNKIKNTVSHRQKAKDTGGTYSTPPRATIIFVAIKIGWVNNNR